MINHQSHGKKQQVIINRKAIDHNLKHNTKFPTFIVIDANGTWHEYHQVELRGAMMDFDPSRKLPSAFFVEGMGMMTGYLDSKAEQSFLNRPKQTWGMWFENLAFSCVEFVFNRLPARTQKPPVADAISSTLAKPASKPPQTNSRFKINMISLVKSLGGSGMCKYHIYDNQEGMVLTNPGCWSSRIGDAHLYSNDEAEKIVQSIIDYLPYAPKAPAPEKGKSVIRVCEDTNRVEHRYYLQRTDNGMFYKQTHVWTDDYKHIAHFFSITDAIHLAHGLGFNNIDQAVPKRPIFAPQRFVLDKYYKDCDLAPIKIVYRFQPDCRIKYTVNGHEFELGHKDWHLIDHKNVTLTYQASRHSHHDSRPFTGPAFKTVSVDLTPGVYLFWEDNGIQFKKIHPSELA